MSEWTLVRAFSTLFDGFSASWRRRRTDARSQNIGTYFCSEIKPPRVSEKSFALFYRSKVLWNCTQAAFFVALAYWTLKNYIAVIKSL